MQIGDDLLQPKKIIILKQISKNSRKRDDNISGRMKPRTDDYIW